MVRTSRIALLVTVIPIILLAIAIAVLGLGNPDLVERVIVGEFTIVDIWLRPSSCSDYIINSSCQ
jgi:hypothetical protein